MALDLSSPWGWLVSLLPLLCTVYGDAPYSAFHLIMGYYYSALMMKNLGLWEVNHVDQAHKIRMEQSWDLDPDQAKLLLSLYKLSTWGLSLWLRLTSQLKEHHTPVWSSGSFFCVHSLHKMESKGLISFKHKPISDPEGKVVFLCLSLSLVKKKRMLLSWWKFVIQSWYMLNVKWLL